MLLTNLSLTPRLPISTFCAWPHKLRSGFSPALRTIESSYSGPLPQSESNQLSPLRFTTFHVKRMHSSRALDISDSSLVAFHVEHSILAAAGSSDSPPRIGEPNAAADAIGDYVRAWADVSAHVKVETIGAFCDRPAPPPNPLRGLDPHPPLAIESPPCSVCPFVARAGQGISLKRLFLLAECDSRGAISSSFGAKW